MNAFKTQKGMSLFGWLALLAVVGFLASAVLKMLPHYMDFMAYEKIIESVRDEAAGDIKNVESFYAFVGRGMEVNTISTDQPLKEYLEVVLEGDEFVAHLNYEKRENLIGNLDLVARFDKEFRVRMP